jgi:KTSC domain
MLDWVELDSSVIAAAAFDAERGVIYLRFKEGAEWAYAGCSAAEWEQLIDPERSAGKFLNSVLIERVQRQVG